jgi:cytochrome c peroxidase
MNLLRTKPLLLAFTAAVFFTQLGCKDQEEVFEINNLKLPAQPFNYKNGRFPSTNNNITNDGATLGRVLFYDKNLSINNTIACASCHKQENAFADVAALSEGFKGGRTTRNSPSLVNLDNDWSFFWDMRTVSLEDLVLQPIANHVEMGMDNNQNLVKKLNQMPYYPPLFEKAFGSKDITSERISKALAQFVKAIVSTDAKYDNVNSWNATQTFTASESAGHNLFFNKLHCTGCHSGNDFSNSGAENIGLEVNYKDNGAGVFFADTKFNGAFKVPTLRNIALTAPYMHDGRMKTLEEVIDHYNAGVQNHANLSTFLRGFLWSGNGGTNNGTCWNCGVSKGGDSFVPLNLTKTDKENLVAFLRTLTDGTLINDEKFSNPFK